MRNTGTWTKGQSGNPRGRPPKKRALTDMLERGGRLKISSSETAQREMIRRVWEGLSTGQMTFGTGAGTRVIELDANDIIQLAKMVLTQIDGPPKAEMDVTSGGMPVLFEISQGLPSDVEQTASDGSDDDET